MLTKVCIHAHITVHLFVWATVCRYVLIYEHVIHCNICGQHISNRIFTFPLTLKKKNRLCFLLKAPDYFVTLSHGFSSICYARNVCCCSTIFICRKHNSNCILLLSFLYSTNGAILVPLLREINRNYVNRYPSIWAADKLKCSYIYLT